MNFYQLLQSKDLILADGAMGTSLQELGLKPGQCPDYYNVEKPELVQSVIAAYVKAGSDIVHTNTFGASKYKLRQFKLDGLQRDIISAGIRIAKETAGNQALVSYSLGPTGELVEPKGKATFAELYQEFAVQVRLAEEFGADLISIETMADLAEARAAVLAVKENTKLPCICQMTFEPGQRTLMGTDPETAVIVLQGIGADVVGANCSGGPEDLLNTIERMAKVARVPLIVQPNAGIPRLEGAKTVFDFTPEQLAGAYPGLVRAGAKILGACCGSTPEHIGAIRSQLAQLEYQAPKLTPKSFLCSSMKTVSIGTGNLVTVVGERINPTGKKVFAQKLKDGNLDVIAKEAIDQVGLGAEVLDVNVGVPGVDEVALMEQAVNIVQNKVRAPIVIDSVKPEAIEAGLRAYNGKALVNSVNGKEESLAKVLPLVKKYGAAVLGLTLDESGIPTKAEDRVAIAEKIINRAMAMGIPKEDIFIDCLVLTASAQQIEVMETLKAIQLVKAKFDVPTVLGVSNVSFGLPERPMINSNFLAMAIGFGLDVAIMNPASREMWQAIDAAQVLTARDLDSKMFIQKYGNREEEKVTLGEVAVDRQLADAILRGFKEQVITLTEQLLQQMQPIDIVDQVIVPSLEQVGDKFERGEFFLPQLIMSADVVQASFAILKEHMGEQDHVKRDKILLATVEGDIHDIGKNIVKVLLENYGYEIVDLGKDVTPEEIIDTCRRQQVALVGLSALMTTTLSAMKQTIELLKQELPHVQVMVGGAVVTEEYAKTIGADFYAKDARAGVKIAQNIFS